MLFTHHCAQGHDVTYIFINPKYQAEICNKAFNVSSLIIREEPSLWVLTLFRVLWQGPERNQGKDLLSDISFPVFQRLV